MDQVLMIIGMIIFVLAAMFFIPQFMTAMACPKVIKIFRKFNAVGPGNAKFVDELGLKPPSFLDRMMKLRDYKPKALQLLMHINVVQMTEDGKLYLSEQDLTKTRWSNM
jgi:hypothetical protein